MNKERRKVWYEIFILGNKLKPCLACNGSGYYDHSFGGKIPKCSSCKGSGKEPTVKVVPFKLWIQKNP